MDELVKRTADAVRARGYGICAAAGQPCERAQLDVIGVLRTERFLGFPYRRSHLCNIWLNSEPRGASYERSWSTEVFREGDAGEAVELLMRVAPPHVSIDVCLSYEDSSSY